MKNVKKILAAAEKKSVFGHYQSGGSNNNQLNISKRSLIYYSINYILHKNMMGRKL